jgi:predicted phosphohydrolase
MKVFVLSDPHLGFAVNKPMDIFGDRWKDHPAKIRANWENEVSQEDVVLVPGDISWGMNFIEAKPDLDFIEALPGRKYICRGNHDYWWTSQKQVSEFTGPSITVLQRSAVRVGSFILAGSRGWSTPLWDGYKPADDDRIYERELGRMQIALEMARRMREPGQKLVYMMHYPPVVDGRASQFAEYLADYGVSLCVYGHLHGSWPKEVNMDYRDVRFLIASADYLFFKPLDITGEVID